MATDAAILTAVLKGTCFLFLITITDLLLQISNHGFSNKNRLQLCMFQVSDSLRATLCNFYTEICFLQIC